MVKINKESCGVYLRSNGIWYWWTIVDGKKIQRSTGEKTKQKAEKVLRSLILDDIEEHAQSQLFGSFVKDIFNHDNGPIAQRKLLRGHTYTRAHAMAQQSSIDKYAVPTFGAKNLRDIKSNDIEWWLLQLPKKYNIANKTANNALSALRQVLDEALMQELIDKNPAANVKPLAKCATPRGCFTVDEVKRLFAFPWAHRHAYVACLLAASTGMRLGEIRALTVEQVHEGYITVDASWNDQEGRKSTKSGYGRIVPISEGIQRELNAVLPPEGLVFTYNGRVPMYDRGIVSRLYERMAELGIDRKAENLTFHSFRHYFNTRLVASGIQSEKTRAVIGHESLEMTEHYAHLDSRDLAEIKKVQREAIGF